VRGKRRPLDDWKGGVTVLRWRALRSTGGDVLLEVLAPCGGHVMPRAFDAVRAALSVEGVR
jgi:hypothetical protein